MHCTESSKIREDTTWLVAAPAPGLVDRRVEITGPTDAKMTINALNSQPSWSDYAAGIFQKSTSWSTASKNVRTALDVYPWTANPDAFAAVHRAAKLIKKG